MNLKGFVGFKMSMQSIYGSKINLSHVSWCSSPFIFHFFVLFHGALMMLTPQSLSEGKLDHLTVTLQHCLGILKKGRKTQVLLFSLIENQYKVKKVP